MRRQLPRIADGVPKVVLACVGWAVRLALIEDELIGRCCGLRELALNHLSELAPRYALGSMSLP
ncbi:hypothetical protein M446_3971 [Methylobacterium sp. 4-46]|nr:hypothetical protein M446_3971 [Methylobacterium sp. 4-46]